MSGQRLARIDELLSLCKEALVALKEGTGFDADIFTTSFLSAFEALQSLEPIDEGDPQLKSYRSKYKELERIRKQLFGRMSTERGDLLNKLSRASRGRRGLDGYRSTLEGDRRGIPRGRG